MTVARSYYTPPIGAELDAAVDEIIALCGGDARAALVAHVVMVGHLNHEMDALRRELAQVVADVSRGYARDRWYRLLERSDTPIPYTMDD